MQVDAGESERESDLDEPDNEGGAAVAAANRLLKPRASPDMAPPASQVSFLLGSVPPPMAQHAGGVEHRDILRDVARYLATVRYHRWVCRPRQRPPA